MRLLIAGLILLAGSVALAADAQPAGKFEDSFDVPRERFVPSGRNTYFILEPGSVYEYVGKVGIKPAKMIVTVSKETAKIDEVQTRIVQTKRWVDGTLVESARNYLAIDSFTKNIYCFGADVEGKPGSWKAGVNDARYGLFMPSRAKTGQKFCESIAPSVSMDRVEFLATGEKKKVPAGAFERCLKLRQTSALDANVATIKLFAPSVGMIAQDDLELVKFPKPALDKKGNPIVQSPDPVIPLEDARAALADVGADPNAMDTWLTAINDPNMSDHDRSDLIEDLNETGFDDPKNLTQDDLPLIMNRIELIEQVSPDAMDQVNADAFDEAYKDLTNMADKLTRR